MRKDTFYIEEKSDTTYSIHVYEHSEGKHIEQSERFSTRGDAIKFAMFNGYKYSSKFAPIKSN